MIAIPPLWTRRSSIRFLFLARLSFFFSFLLFFSLYCSPAFLSPISFLLLPASSSAPFDRGCRSLPTSAFTISTICPDVQISWVLLGDCDPIRSFLPLGLGLPVLIGVLFFYFHFSSLDRYPFSALWLRILFILRTFSPRTNPGSPAHFIQASLTIVKTRTTGPSSHS